SPPREACAKAIIACSISPASCRSITLNSMVNATVWIAANWPGLWRLRAWGFSQIRSSNDRLGTVFPLDRCNDDIAEPVARKLHGRDGERERPGRQTLLVGPWPMPLYSAPGGGI